MTTNRPEWWISSCLSIHSSSSSNRHRLSSQAVLADSRRHTAPTKIADPDSLRLKQISAKHFDDYLQDTTNIVCPYQSSDVDAVVRGLETFLCGGGGDDHRLDSVKVTVERLIEHKSLTFMDFGCGDGRLLRAVHRRFGMPCLGLDVSEDLIRFAQETAAADETGEHSIQFACVDCTKVDDVLPYAGDNTEENSVGMVYVYMVHAGLRRSREALEAIARRSGGRTIFVTNDYHVNLKDDVRGGEFLEWGNWRCVGDVRECALRFHIVEG